MGWGDAYAGLSQQAFGYAIDNLRGRQQQKYQTERDEIASKAQSQQEEARRNWEQKMLKTRAELDKSARKDEQMFRSTEAEKAREFEMNDPFRQAAEDRAERMTRVQEQYASRSAGSGSSEGSSSQSPSGPSASEVNTIRREFSKATSPQEAYNLAKTKYGQAIADAAFPGVAASSQERRGLWQNTGNAIMGGLRGLSGNSSADDINSILNKYQ